MPTLNVSIDFSFADNLVSSLESSVYNTARSADGFGYFAAVDRGRREVRPVRAKALRIPVSSAPGGAIFRKFARAAPPRNITARSLEEVFTNAVAAAADLSVQTLRGWIAGFLNGLAGRHVDSLARATPRGFTGVLGRSYLVRKAE